MNWTAKKAGKIINESKKAARSGWFLALKTKGNMVHRFKEDYSSRE